MNIEEKKRPKDEEKTIDRKQNINVSLKTMKDARIKAYQENGEIISIKRLTNKP